MKIGQPLCDLHSCRWYFDGNCRDKDGYEKCPYTFLNQNVLQKVKDDLQYYLNVNEEKGVVYIPKFVVKKLISKLEMQE